MFSYLILAMSLVAVSILIIILFQLKLPRYRLLVNTFLILSIAMLIFDTYLTSLAVVLYNDKLILPFRLGSIPLEDFSYLIAVVLLIPTLFEFFHHDKKD